MICPKCGSEGMSRVIDSREKKKDNTTYRRRECTVCGCRYSTVEKLNKVYKRRKNSNGKGA